MYGLEALSFNVKDGYVGEARKPVITAKSIPCALQVQQSDEQPLSINTSDTFSFQQRACLHMLMYAADAVVRGHRSGLLTTSDYNNLCQCETLDDIKLNLVCITQLIGVRSSLHCTWQMLGCQLSLKELSGLPIFLASSSRILIL